MSHFSWPEITHFHNVRKSACKFPGEILRGKDVVAYLPKVKLHGTNAGVYLRAGRATAQSRTAVITPGNDNAGFAAWVESRANEWIDGPYRKLTHDAVVFGEWCGPGVQKGVAASLVGSRFFAVFAVLPVSANGQASDSVIVNPDTIASIVAGVPDVYVLPWFETDMTLIPWLERSEDLAPIIDSINQKVQIVESEDPWVKSTFGIAGLGEGLVYYPISHTSFSDFSNLAFKAKGSAHKTIAHSAPAQAKPSRADDARAFAELVLTEARLEQGARAIIRGNSPFCYDQKLIGPFIAWVQSDVKKECMSELEESGLEWKNVSHSVSNRAKEWYCEKLKEL